MILDRLNAKAVTPNAWRQPVAPREHGVLARTNPATGKREFTPYSDGSADLQRLIVDIIKPIERAQAAGRTEDNLVPIVQQWAGKLAKLVTIARVTKRGTVRILQLQVGHPIAAVELRPRLPQLVAALQDTGIKEVRL